MAAIGAYLTKADPPPGDERRSHSLWSLGLFIFLLRAADRLRAKNGAFLKTLLLAPFSMLLIGALVAACHAKEAAQPVAEEKEIGLQVEGLNYSGIPIGVFYVNDQWAGNVGTFAGGGGVATSIGLPRAWNPGLKVTIKWRNDLLYAKEPEGLYTRVIDVPQYSGLLGGSFWVAFLPDDQIKVYASQYAPGHPEFPNSELINPRQYCLIRPVCHDKFYPGERVPEAWETLPIALQPSPPPGSVAVTPPSKDGEEKPKR
ncbi:DUF3304 domain-containing protein [Variovorax sp. PAMC26660]|uniref:DUF3304 domain-containing protein n=1 Tax=Variovorax sp. PAMC26660 TaxID=2762322 RepID=UPI00164DF952|nr:DUF3304 domain-containing protein [Variovorax sp. PAMC26660]QNK67112.1 DUF3304 domain-containing protein [Variovorax sp. PAMC26660]